jgi:hypothetical protein
VNIGDIGDDYANHGDHPDHDGHLADPNVEHYQPDERPLGGDLGWDPHQPADDSYHWAGDHQAEAASHWHEQQHDQSGGVSSQEFVLASLSGTPHTEAELISIAEDHGWYIPGGGTPLYEAGSLLEHFGVPVESRHDGRLEDLELALADGMDVIVVLSEGPPSYTDLALELDDYPGIPGQDCARAVQVIGVDRSDSLHPAVLVNDPASAVGAGQAVSLTDFMDAWAGSDNFTVLAGSQRDA